MGPGFFKPVINPLAFFARCELYPQWALDSRYQLKQLALLSGRCRVTALLRCRNVQNLSEALSPAQLCQNNSFGLSVEVPLHFTVLHSYH